MGDPTIVMIGTSAPGGVAAVLDVYRQCGLFDRWRIRYLATHNKIDAGRSTKALIAVKSLVRYLALLVRGDVALLHAHASSRSSFWRKSLFIFPTFMFRRPVIFHLHSGEFMHFYHEGCGLIGRFVVRYILDHSDRIIVLSETWKTQISGITKNQFVTPIVNPLAVRHGAEGLGPRDQQTLLFLGRLVESKGLFVLLGAIARLVYEFPDLKLLCAGEGDFGRVRDTIDDLGISRVVRLLGWVTGRDKQELLESATVLILPSYAEGLPMSVLEAMAVALPVIATRVGGIPDLISTGKEGVLITPGNMNELQQAIELLLRDSTVRHEMGRRGYERFKEKFSADTALPLLEGIYQELGVVPTHTVGR